MLSEVALHCPRCGHGTTAGPQPHNDATPTLAPGSAVSGGRFVVETLLGAGAAGEVFRARDTRLQRLVALKVLHADLLPDPAGQRRIEREASLLARIGHPRVVSLLDVVHVAGRLTLVLEYLPGGSLAQRLAAGSLALTDALALGDDILAGLGAIHAAGAVHRDLKPANVLLGSDGRARIADLGIAYDASDVRLTRLNARLGTPGYMSPEQLHGGKVDARSDLYSAGVVLCELLAGTQPDHLGRPPLARAQAAVGDGSVLVRALQTDPAARWPSATEMAQAWARLGGRKPAGVGVPSVTSVPTAARGGGAARVAPWQLVVVAGPRRGEVLPVAGRLFLGRRDPELHSPDRQRAEFDDDRMSFAHCTLAVLADGRLAVYDDGSRNGTFVDDAPVGAGVVVAAGMEIRCGRTRLRVVFE